MANLDKILKEIETMKDVEEDVKTYPLTIRGETFDVKTMTRKEKLNFLYSQSTNKANLTVGEIVKKMIPYIYRALDLAPLAVKAKDRGLITSYYDIVEEAFEPVDIIKIIGFIAEINKFDAVSLESEEDIEELKKQSRGI